MFVRNRTVGGWTTLSVITGAELETWDANIANAIDGAGGGAYAPSAIIEIGGAGLRVAGPFSTTGTTTLGDASGDTVTVNGTTTFVNPVTFSEGVTFNENISINGLGTFSAVTVSTAGSGTGALTVEGATTLVGAVATQGDTTLGDAVGDTLTVNATSTFASPVTCSSSATFSGAVVCNGNVDIGNAATDILTLGCRLYISPTGSVEYRYTVLGDANAAVAPGSGGMDIALYTSDAVMTADRDVTIADANAGNVFEVSRYHETGAFTLNVRNSGGALIVPLTTAAVRTVKLLCIGGSSWRIIEKG